jgi:hypothetical protein
MIFRSKEGKLIEINRRDYNNDSSYYNAIIEALYGKIESDAPKVNELTRITNIIKGRV